MNRSNQVWTVPPTNEGDSLRAFLKLKLEISGRRIAKLLDSGSVTVNDRTEKFGSKKLKRGEKICLLGTLDFGPTDRTDAVIDVLHEDDELLVINKTAGIPSQITRDPKRQTSEGLVHESFRKKGLDLPTLVHRLDRDTSGVLIFAKKSHVASSLMEGFRHRNISKTYLAICEGTPPIHEGKWTHHLGPCRKKGGKVVHGPLNSGGQKAITDFRVIATGGGRSLWELRPKTGRTHQLRVQCSVARHPIVGDDHYGAKASSSRHLLHAAHLSLANQDGLITSFSAPVHQDFSAALREMGVLKAYEAWKKNFSP